MLCLVVSHKGSVKDAVAAVPAVSAPSAERETQVHYVVVLPPEGTAYAQEASAVPPDPSIVATRHSYCVPAVERFVIADHYWPTVTDMAIGEVPTILHGTRHLDDTGRRRINARSIEGIHSPQVVIIEGTVTSGTDQCAKVSGVSRKSGICVGGGNLSKGIYGACVRCETYHKPSNCVTCMN